MLTCFEKEADEQAILIQPLDSQQFQGWLSRQADFVKNWVSTCNFTAKKDSFCLVPTLSGTLSTVLLGVNDGFDQWSYASLAEKLPGANYLLNQTLDSQQQHLAALAWGRAAYRFNRYKKSEPQAAKLVLGTSIPHALVESQLKAIYLVRDLINLPAEDCGPAQLADFAEQVAKKYSAKFSQIVGEKLLKYNYPAIHAVGRASPNQPRLIDFSWGDKKHPLLTLVGKGVCFDSGGLDLKSAQGMRIMKKDMGGAAHVLGLAKLIMETQLPVRLRVLIPAVENAVSGNSYRPGDIISSRKGLTIEIGNTDAEGRVVMADALHEAVSEDPEMLIDFSTLTGAARIALGTDIPVFFTPQDDVAAELLADDSDRVWQLPLYQPYRQLLDSTVADITNSGEESYGGAITAALFLQEFTRPVSNWLHFDLMAWNLKARPGRPAGGEAMGLLNTFRFLQRRFVEKFAH